MKQNLKNKIIKILSQNIDLQNKVIYNIINNLLIKCDDKKQYSRRYCLRIHGIESDSKNALERLNLEFKFALEFILLAKKNLEEYAEPDMTGKKVKSIIIKFKS